MQVLINVMLTITFEFGIFPYVLKLATHNALQCLFTQNFRKKKYIYLEYVSIYAFEQPAQISKTM